MTDAADRAAALLHRLHLAGVRFPWRGGVGGQYIAVGPMSDADLDEIKRLRPHVLRLLDTADLVAMTSPEPVTLNTAGVDALHQDDAGRRMNP